jgi:membrane protease YdiL (CAAX protease family)
MTLSRPYVLIVFFLTLLLGAVVLGPLLYFGVAFIFPIPFHRAMDRALLISSVGAVALFWPRISLGKLWPWKRGAWQQVLLGYFIAAVTIQAMIGFDLALSGFTSAHLTGQQIAGRLGVAFIAAFLIPPLEETVFRGFIQGELVQGFGTRWGWLSAAFIFMLAHFLKIPVELDRQPVHWWSGASALGAAFMPLVKGAFLCGRGLNLFLIGLILGGIFLRSGSLWLNAGLHGGWILALLLFTGLTRPLDPPRVPFFAGDILSNLSTTVVFILLGIWLWYFYPPPSGGPATGVNAR